MYSSLPPRGGYQRELDGKLYKFLFYFARQFPFLFMRYTFHKRMRQIEDKQNTSKK